DKRAGPISESRPGRRCPADPPPRRRSARADAAAGGAWPAHSPRRQRRPRDRRRGGPRKPAGWISESDAPAAEDDVIEPKHDNGADDRDQHAVDVESRDRGRAELGEDEPP